MPSNQAVIELDVETWEVGRSTQPPLARYCMPSIVSNRQEEADRDAMTGSEAHLQYYRIGHTTTRVYRCGADGSQFVVYVRVPPISWTQCMYIRPCIC